MEYERYKPKSRRPFGMGAFFDFGLAMTRHFAAGSPRAGVWRKKRLVVPPAQQSAEERWDAEGGNPNLDRLSVAWRTERASTPGGQSPSTIAGGGNVRETRD